MLTRALGTFNLKHFANWFFELISCVDFFASPLLSSSVYLRAFRLVFSFLRLLLLFELLLLLFTLPPLSFALSTLLLLRLSSLLATSTLSRKYFDFSTRSSIADFRRFSASFWRSRISAAVIALEFGCSSNRCRRFGSRLRIELALILWSSSTSSRRTSNAIDLGPVWWKTNFGSFSLKSNVSNGIIDWFYLTDDCQSFRQNRTSNSSRD